MGVSTPFTLGMVEGCLEAPRPLPNYFGGKIGNLASRTWLRERTAWAPAAISLRLRESYEPENGPHVSTKELKQEVFAET